MDEKRLIELINIYFDGELKKEEEAFLFSELALSTEGRDYFKNLNMLRAAVEESAEEFPEELDERVLKSLGRFRRESSGIFTRHRMRILFPYAFLLIILIINMYVFIGQFSYYRNEVEDLSKQVKRQNETIQVLYNSLPGIEIRAASENEITIKPSL